MIIGHFVSFDPIRSVGNDEAGMEGTHVAPWVICFALALVGAGASLAAALGSL